MAFTASGLLIVVTATGSIAVMISNVKKGESFTFINVLPVFEKNVFNEKGKIARKVYNWAFFSGCGWAVLFVGYRSAFV